jgi:hypothetical protein
MQQMHLNLLVVLGAGVAKFIVGGLWYSPILFAKPWMKLLGLKESSMKAGMGKAMLVELVGCVLMAYVLAYAIHYANAQGAVQGMMAGFWNWLGFIATIQIHSVIFEKKPFNLFLINTSFQLVGCLLMGAILVLWS